MKFWSCILTLVLFGCAQGQESIKETFRAPAIAAKQYCEAHKMDTTICILVDMSIHSGKYRLVLWNLKADSAAVVGLCSHGSCGGEAGPAFSFEKPVFSNVPQSYCSSKGHYKIGARGYSNWGVHFNYKLHGLDATNNNAFQRVVVLHSYEGVPDEEIYPDYNMTSWGCPMVSNNVMHELDKWLKKAKGDVLLWVYE